MIFLIVPMLALSIEFSRIHIGGTPMRMRLTPYGLLIVDSIGGRVVLLREGEKIEIDGFRFPVWADACCGGIYVTDLKSSSVFLYKNGKIVKTVKIPKPEMVKIWNERVFVSDGNKIHILDKDLIKIRTYEFPSRSVYFYLISGKLFHMEYWGDHPDVTVVDLNSGERISHDFGMKRPFRVVKSGHALVFLDYMGKLVVLKGLDRKTFTLPSFTYGMTVDKDRVFVSTLSKPEIYVIDTNDMKLRRIRIPSPAGSLENCCGRLIACGIFEDEVYVLKNEKIEKRIECEYPIMVEPDPPFVYVLCSDSGEVLKLDLSD